MVSTAENNKRIAKNTLLLYFRMLFMMAVTLYTSRVVLNVLGVEDYGIYNVVGGVVAMFSMLSGSLSAAITRFITFELGTGNLDNLKKIFSSAVTIQIALAIVIVLLAETLGVWFLNERMNIPEARVMAANWVLQFSIIAFVINIISVPYNAVIIAHERMSAFAYISIIEAVGKLAIAFLIAISPIDRLIFYSILMCVVASIVRIAYRIYCRKHFEECIYKLYFDKDLLKRMFNFAGWNYIGSISGLLKDQGVNIILYFFCGAAVNAARGISIQVNTAVNNFVSNFITALNPQITKSYAEGNKRYMNELIFNGTRFSYYLLFCLSVPLLANTEYILKYWLNIVPPYTVEFVQLILILSLSDVLYRPLLIAHLATGNIKTLQIIAGGLNFAICPLSYLALYWGYQPTSTLWICIIFSFIGLFVRIYLFKKIEKFDVLFFIKEVILNVIVVTVVSLLCVKLVQFYFFNITTLWHLIASCIFCFLLTLLICVNVGMTSQEKHVIAQKLRSKLHK